MKYRVGDVVELPIAHRKSPGPGITGPMDARLRTRRPYLTRDSCIIIGYREGIEGRLLVYRLDGAGWAIDESDIDTLVQACRKDARYLIKLRGKKSGWYISGDTLLGEVAVIVLYPCHNSSSYKISDWVS